MIVLGIGLSIPASLVAAFAPTDTVLFGGPHRGRPLGRHGLPDDAGAHHGALVRPSPDALDRDVVGPRRRRRDARARSWPASCSLYFAWGSVFLITLPLAVLALYMAWQARAGARQRGARSRSTTSAASCRRS